jgi:hypothetical protein
MVSFNGEVYDICGTGESDKLCPWETFQRKLQALFPSRGDCPEFYANYNARSQYPTLPPIKAWH